MAERGIIYIDYLYYGLVSMSAWLYITKWPDCPRYSARARPAFIERDLPKPLVLALGFVVESWPVMPATKCSCADRSQPPHIYMLCRRLEFVCETEPYQGMA